MKKIFAIMAATILFAGIANAQIGIRAGYAPQTYKTTYTSGSTSIYDTMAMQGFFVGADYTVPVSGDLNVTVGIQYRMNTYKKVNDIVVETITTTANQSLIDVPIMINYGLPLTGDLKAYIFLGPTVTYALSGKTNMSHSISSALNTETNWYGDNSKRNAFDISGTIGLNFDFNGIRLFGGYNMGLLNLTTADNTTVKGSNLFLGVGYNL